MMTLSKESVISHLICYLTQAAEAGCVFLAASRLIIDTFTPVALLSDFNTALSNASVLLS